MADVILDCEYVNGDSVTVLGLYSPGLGVTQLHSDTLTWRRLTRFINTAMERCASTDSFVVCHGPDIGRVENHFDRDLRNRVV